MVASLARAPAYTHPTHEHRHPHTNCRHTHIHAHAYALTKSKQMKSITHFCSPCLKPLSLKFTLTGDVGFGAQGPQLQVQQGHLHCPHAGDSAAGGRDQRGTETSDVFMDSRSFLRQHTPHIYFKQTCSFCSSLKFPSKTCLNRRCWIRCSRTQTPTTARSSPPFSRG